MGFLSTLPTTRGRGMRADAFNDYNQAWFGGEPLPSLWMSSLNAAGVAVSPDLAMTLSALYSGVTMIGYDLATLPPITYRNRDDGGKDIVRASPSDVGAGGIGDLAYKLRWAPNNVQTSAEFWLSMIVQYLMREVAYAEIVSGPRGFLDQLLPRHPDRVRAERLPSGFLRYRLTEVGGGTRYLTQDEMFVVRGLSFDGGLNQASRIMYGAQWLGISLATSAAVGAFFKSGMKSALLASYTGDLDDEAEKRLHASIARYANGPQSHFGLLLAPDNVTIKNLSPDPDKAQMMLAQEWTVKEVARSLRMPGSKLGVTGTETYASSVQKALDYVIGCLRPTAVLIEQSLQRDIILAKDTYLIQFALDELLRADPDARAIYFAQAIQNRWMRPSEVRLRENMNPDPDLDKLSEGDNRPGSSTQPATSKTKPNAESGPMLMHAFLLVHDNAVQCLRRERAAVEKLARKHADDVSGWQAGLRDFYSEHAGFVAQKMRLPITIARGYAAQHGTQFEQRGLKLIDGDAGGHWEREEAQTLASLAVDCGERAA